MRARRRGGTPPIQALRKVLLAALVLFVAGVALLFWFGRQGKRTDTPERSVAEDSSFDPGDGTAVGRGYQKEFTQNGRRVFAVSADLYTRGQDERVSLQNVRIEMDREDGGAYELASESGVFDVESGAATLAGSVVVRGPRGLELRSDELELGGQGNLVTSQVPVEFALSESIGGRAAKLSFNLRRDRFVLSGNVWVVAREPEADEKVASRMATEMAEAHAADDVEGAPSAEDEQPIPSIPGGATLRCQRLLFERRNRTIHADESVRVAQGEHRLSARRLSLQLSDNESDIEVINARWDVVALLQEAAAEPAAGQSAKGAEKLASYRLAGNRLTLAFNADDQPERVELLSEGGPDVELVRESPDGREQTIRANQVLADFVDGRLRHAEALDGVKLDETAAGRNLRSARGRTAELIYSERDPEGRMKLDGEVVYTATDLEASGDRADLSLSSTGSGEVVGEPAIIVAESGRLEAPKIFQQDGRLHAVDGVRAELERGQIELGAGNTGDGPVKVQSQEAFWNDAERQYEFRGNVRAWQGENYLLADEMMGEVAREIVTARGSVRTVWKIEPEAGATAPATPVEVTSESMTYNAVRRFITYQGSVHARQDGRNLWCQRIHGFLLEGGGFDTLNCSGATRIEDPASGATVVGKRAVYEPKAERIIVSGSPVILTKTDGTRIQGDRLVYDLEAGTAQIQLVETSEDKEGGENDDPASGT